MFNSLDPLHTHDSQEHVCSTHSEETRHTGVWRTLWERAPQHTQHGLSNRIPVHTEADPSNLSLRAGSLVSFQPIMTGIPNSRKWLWDFIYRNYSGERSGSLRLHNSFETIPLSLVSRTAILDRGFLFSDSFWHCLKLKSSAKEHGEIFNLPFFCVPSFVMPYPFSG